MDYIEYAKQLLAEHERFEAEKPYTLHVDRQEAIPDEVSHIKHLSFSGKLDSSYPITAVLPELLQRAPMLERLHVFGPKITWKSMCGMDLTNLLELSFSLAGEITEEQLSAPGLKRLCVYGNADLTPMELMVHPVPHIDFSRISSLEALELRHFQQLDPTDFQDIASLKRLVITDWEIDNLDWLCDASYHLESLCLDSPIVDCNGIAAQTGIKRLEFYHHYLRDVTPLEKLERLQILNLSYGAIVNECGLREMGITELVITDADREARQIKNDVKDLTMQAVLGYRRQNALLQNMDNQTAFKRTILSHIEESSFDERIEQLIQAAFNGYLRDLESGKKYVSKRWKSNFTELFIAEALRSYPFLSVQS